MFRKSIYDFEDKCFMYMNGKQLFILLHLCMYSVSKGFPRRFTKRQFLFSFVTYLVWRISMLCSIRAYLLTTYLCMIQVEISCWLVRSRVPNWNSHWIRYCCQTITNGHRYRSSLNPFVFSRRNKKAKLWKIAWKNWMLKWRERISCCTKWSQRRSPID